MKSYDPQQDLKHIIFLDANNWYGYALSKFLPRSELKWIDPNEFDLNKYMSNSLRDCVLKVDLKYPKELPELHNDYPLAPDKIKKQMLSTYQLKQTVQPDLLKNWDENLKVNA